MFMIPKGLTLESDNKSDPPTILSPADAIFYKTATTPIQAGGQARGWIFSIVRGIKREDLSDGTTIKIWFQDVLGKSYSATHVLAKEQIGPPKYYPDGSGGLRRSIEKSGC